MRGRNKPVVRANAVHHIYQNTRNGYLIFYSVTDYLVLFSILSVKTGQYGMTLLGICMMPDHLHLVVYVKDPERFHAFMRDFTSIFTRFYNRHYHLSGSLFNTPFGGVPKLGHKKIRSAIAYVYNNPVEGQLAQKVEDNRWNFLAYAAEKHPFSEKLHIDRARWDMRKALNVVKAYAKDGNLLDYPVIGDVTKNLSPRELQQFTDYVIRRYHCIDYQATISYYNSYGKMVLALDANTGSEYDIQEDTYAKDYRIYKTMIRELCLVKGYESMKKVLTLPLFDRKRLGRDLMFRTGATEKEVAKLLRL